MKRIIDFRRKKGFTLMEVIIAVAMLGIVMLAISSLLLAGSRYFSLGREQSDAQADGRLAMDQILDDIRYSKEITLIEIPSVKVPPYSYIYIENGNINRFIYDYDIGDWETATTPGTFTSPDVTYLFTKNGSDGIDINLKSISEDLKQTFPISATIKLPNFAINRTVFTSDSDTASQAIRFMIDNEALLLDSLSDPATPGLTPSGAPSTTPSATPTTIPNSIPAAVDDSYATNKNVTLSVPFAGILENDSDADGDVISPEIVDDVPNGKLTLLPDGSFTYVPKKNDSGTYKFKYKVYDGKNYSNTATVTINVNK